MKKYKVCAMLLCLACAAGFTACDDDDAVKQELQSPALSGSFSDYQSLRFSWDAVANTLQYGYKLYNADGDVVSSGVTGKTSAEFTGLTPATTYTLRVWAFAGLDTDYSTSPAAELTATTAALVKLAAPQGLAAETPEGSATVSWNPVEDAETYIYTLASAEGETVKSGTTEATSVRFLGLDEGDYTFSVSATTSQGGFIPGDASSISFRFVPAAQFLWKTAGAFDTYRGDDLLSTRTLELVANSDGTYSLKNFYGAEGYDLTFGVNADGTLAPVGGDAEDGYWMAETGNEESPWIYIYIASADYTGFRGDSSEGYFWMCYYGGANLDDWLYSEFSWAGSEQGGSVLNADALAGEYHNHVWGVSYVDDYNGAEFDEDDYTAVITKIDDTTVSVDGLYYNGYPVKGVIDASARTVTFDSQAYDQYYTFADSEDMDKPVVATVAADGTITFSQFGLWYGGYTYFYADCVLTPADSSAKAAVRTAKNVSAKRVGKAAEKAPEAPAHRARR